MGICCRLVDIFTKYLSQYFFEEQKSKKNVKTRKREAKKPLKLTKESDRVNVSIDVISQHSNKIEECDRIPMDVINPILMEDERGSTRDSAPKLKENKTEPNITRSSSEGMRCAPMYMGGPCPDGQGRESVKSHPTTSLQEDKMSSEITSIHPHSWHCVPLEDLIRYYTSEDKESIQSSTIPSPSEEKDEPTEVTTQYKSQTEEEICTPIDFKRSSILSLQGDKIPIDIPSIYPHSWHCIPLDELMRCTSEDKESIKSGTEKIDGVKNSLIAPTAAEKVTSTEVERDYFPQNGQIHDVPMDVIIRPFPAEALDEREVARVVDALQHNPESVAPVDLWWVRGRDGGDYYFALGPCSDHRLAAHRRLDHRAVPARLHLSTVDELRCYLGNYTPDLP